MAMLFLDFCFTLAWECTNHRACSQLNNKNNKMNSHRNFSVEQPVLEDRRIALRDPGYAVFTLPLTHAVALEHRCCGSACINNDVY